MNVKCVLLSLLAVSLLPTTVFAKKAKKAPADEKGHPLIEISLSSKFERYLKIRKSLDDELKELEKDKDDAGYQQEKKDLDEEVKDLVADVTDRIERETKSIERDMKALNKKLDSLDSQLEKSADNEKQYDKIMEQVGIYQKKLKTLSKVKSSYDMFKIACSTNKKGLEDTPFGLKGGIAPPINGKTFDKKEENFSLDNVSADYKIIAFFSMENRDSLTGLREAIGLSGRRTASKETAVIAVNVDTNKKAVAEAMTYLSKQASRCTPIHDSDWKLCGAYKVRFLPQVVLTDSSGSVLEVVVGGGIRKNIQAAIKDHVRENRKRR